MPSDGAGGCTRRTLVRATSAVGTAALAGCLGGELASGPPPRPNTWPLARYGPRNTAHSPDASPPADPTVERFPTTGHATAVVVGGTGGARRVMVGGYDGLTAHRPDGTVVWRGHEADVVAVRPGAGVCYAVERTLRALALGDGTVQWSADLPGAPAYAVVPSSRGPFVPFTDGVAAYDRDGDLRYRVSRGEGFGSAGVAVDDAVYVTDVGMVERLSPRGPLRRIRNRPPAAAWRVERGIDFGRVPIVDGDDVYVTDEVAGGTGGGVVALDADGTVRWRRTLGERPTGAALGPDRLFVAVLTAGIDGGGERLLALRRTDGTTAWEASAAGRGDGYYVSPVVAAGSVLVGGGAPDGGGYVTAYARDGGVRWTRRAETEVWDVAAVGDRVYATTKGGHLYVLS